MSTSTPPPIPATYPLTGVYREERFHSYATSGARSYIRQRLQAAGIDYRSHYHDTGGLSHDAYQGTLHLMLFAAAELALEPDQAPAPIALPLHSGAGHTTYWTRAGQREITRTLLGIYQDVVQAVDDIWEIIERNVAVMLDTSEDADTRQTAWGVVRRLHLIERDAPGWLPNIEAAVARVRARTDPPATDLPAFAGVHQDRLRAAGARRLRWLLGDPPRPTSSQETMAADRIARVVREYALRIARAADAGAVRIEHAAGVRAVEAVTIGAAPRWRQSRSGALDADLPGPTPVTLPTVTPATPPFRAAVIEAWSAPAEPGQPATAQPTVIESAVSADTTKLRATIVRGATIGVDRLVLDWLVEAPADPVTVTATARNVTGASQRTFIVPAPVRTGD